MNKIEAYKKLCDTEPTIPIFSQYWWLDSLVGPTKWDIALVSNGDEILASMPYTTESRITGLKVSAMPTLTQSLGPWIRKANGKYSTQLSHEMGLQQKLIDQLPAFAHFTQNWHHHQTNWLPFYWNGFEQTTRYTYIIDDITDLNCVFSEFSSSYRNKIRKAKQILSIKEDLDIETFYKINSLTFSRQNISIPYSFDLLKRHDKELARREQRKIFYAIDSDGSIHSALYLTWDKLSSYVDMAGEDPEKRKSGAGILLIWEAIKYTRNQLQLNRLDFEGSMIQGVERVRRDCGARQYPYYTVSRTTSIRWKAFSLLRKFIENCTARMKHSLPAHKPGTQSDFANRN